MNPSSRKTDQSQEEDTTVKRILLLFRPSRRSLGVLSVSGWVVVILSLCFCGMLLISQQDGMQSDALNSRSAITLLVVFFGFIILPGLALAAIRTAFLEKSNALRALLWGVATGLVACGGMVSLIAMLTSEDPLDPIAAVGFLLIFVSPVVLLVSLPTVYFTLRALPEIQAVLKDDLTERTLGFIQARGQVSFAELAAEAGIPLAEVDNLVDALLRSGRLAGTLDAKQQTVFTAALLAQKQQALLDEVHERGKVRLDVLGRQLRASPEQLRDWIYQLVARNQFRGYVNWQEGTLYSTYARKIGADSQCPACGGKLTLAGAMLIRCEHCGSEILR